MRQALLFGLLLSTIAPGCSGDDEDSTRFECGNGSCERGSEVCVIGGPSQCSTCVPAPAACSAAPSCQCLPPGNDPAWEARCIDPGVCEDVEGDVVLTCQEVSWGCG